MMHETDLLVSVTDPLTRTQLSLAAVKPFLRTAFGSNDQSVPERAKW
jgi:hypothetical protein